MGARGPQKKKASYHILFVTDTGPMEVRHFAISVRAFASLLAVIAFLIVTQLSVHIVLSRKLEDADNRMESLKVQVNEVVQQNLELIAEKKVLQEKIDILTDMVNERGQEEGAAAQSCILTGYTGYQP